MRGIKPYEYELLAQLRKDGRMSLTALSKKIRVPISTLYDRLQQHRKDVIKNIAALVDYEKIGFHARAHIILKVHRDDKALLHETLRVHKNVNSLYKINNGYDFMADIIFRNIKDLEDFMCTLKDDFRIKGSLVYYIIDDIMEEQFMSGSTAVLT